ncbi:acylphosphatase [Halomonas sp. hl-4]|uniref:acylphosphatase n=1 Tax=Halomonas sp. hl-4 TaxID=1761789 RepID=UPI000BB9399C|nr:acylphosphatase [Halomonas sp. hl-4]SNY96064.1 acylphosphatase [Halomonas sp. hl-4]
MAECCVRALVTGKVQGVWFRRSTQQQALQQRLTGYAKNLPDGRVEVLLCGSPENVKTVSEWLWRGPDGAQVTHVEFNVLDQCHAPDHFANY